MTPRLLRGGPLATVRRFRFEVDVAFYRILGRFVRFRVVKRFLWGSPEPSGKSRRE